MPGTKISSKTSCQSEVFIRYFVVGAAGSSGKRLTRKILDRKGSVLHFLIRRESESKVVGLREYWVASAARVVPVYGDLTVKNLGLPL